MMTAMDKLKLLIEKFEATQTRYRKFGATDTEPDAVFQMLLVKAFKNREKPEVPKTADDWDLYSREKGSGRAAASLARTAQKCVDFFFDFKTASIKEALAIQDYLKDYCWRVTW
jgi:hypothetical protein